jgi:type II restriction/modification system DNA methylase subunit YeeA
MKALFEAMSTGGYFGADEVLHFNGGLFADAHVIELRPDEIRNLIDANGRDWSSVEPSIFGTLFERTLDPNKRSQIGAHYTSRTDIETLLQPVVMQPLRREWDAVKADCEKLWAKVQESSRKSTGKGGRRGTIPAKQSPAGKKLEKHLRDFTHRLEDVTILDPACGSGNFLYVALNLILDLNKEVISYGAQRGITLFPSVRPTQLLGIEINEYAQELASVVIWIGYLQWMHDNGFTPQLDPVLEPFESIRRMDAILDVSDPGKPREPEWPAAEFIVGNPPFLGGKLMRAHLGNEYMESVFKVWDGNVRPEADLCCYWFEKARAQIERKKSNRAGLLATQGIRGGANRETLKRLKDTGDIFFAESDREWILEGANVHVSMVGFDGGDEPHRVLDGRPTALINSNLTATADITQAKRLAENAASVLWATRKEALSILARHELSSCYTLLTHTDCRTATY